jgi:glycosyltransferase involved in cell wall biosynthesis
MKVAILTTDNRDHYRNYQVPNPSFGPAIEAVLQGLSQISELELHVVSCTQQPMSAPKKLSENTYFHLLHVPKIGWLRTGYQGCIRAIRHKLREVQPDIVHGQGTERECALGAVFSGFPNLVTIHGNMRAIARATKVPIGSFWWWAARLEQFTLPRTYGVLCNSAYTESVVRSRARRTWRVPNAVRREFFEAPVSAPAATSKPILLNIGVIGPHKRQFVLLELAEQLNRKGFPFELQFIGSADPRSRYTADFLRRILADPYRGFAKYVGTKSLSELLLSLDAASALIHIPSEEAFGLVVAEALTRNLKFFGTNVGGLPDIVEGVETAELFPLEDLGGLRSAMAAWLGTANQRPKAAADEMRSRYHPDIIANRHLEIYREIRSSLSR